MNAVSFDCCGGCVPLGPGQSVQDVIDLHTMTCEERERLNFLAEHRDEARRDISVLGDIEAEQLNRLARRNHGTNPFEASGDALALLRKAHR